MPAVTRSAARNNAPRSRIEDPTPESCSMTVRRTRPRNLRTTLKRKLAVINTEGSEEDEPSRKKYATHVRTTTREKLPSTCHKSRDVEVNTKNPVGKKASKRHLPSRIPQRCASTRNAVSTKPNPAKTNTTKGNVTGGRYKGKENRNDNNINESKDDHSPSVETPESVAARLKTYSAFCRSKQKKVNGKEKNATARTNDKSESPKSSIRGFPMSESDMNSRLVQENESNNTNCERENQDGNHDDDQVIHKEMFNCDDEKEADETDLDAAGEDKNYYHKKYLDMVTKMKTLQEKFLKAQQNALRNRKVSDSLIDQLRISLETELQNVCSAKEECQKREKEIKKLERAKEAISEKLVAFTQQDVSTEKKDQEKNCDDSVDGVGLNELLQRKLKEQRALVKFYSTLTGISMTQDETHLNNSKFDSFHCEYLPEKSKKHAVRFRLMYDREIDELEYCPNPRSPGSEDLISNLPEYLQDNMFFFPNHAPRFLSRLLRNVEKL